MGETDLFIIEVDGTLANPYVVAGLLAWSAVPSVGFWGAPPVWIAPAVAGAVGVLVWWWNVRRRRARLPPA
jgi:hypothetical protein